MGKLHNYYSVIINGKEQNMSEEMLNNVMQNLYIKGIINADLLYQMIDNMLDIGQYVDLAFYSGYKVVRKISKNLYGPATVNALQSMRFRINQTTRVRRSGAITLFDTFYHAYQFQKDMFDDLEESAILLCEYEEHNIKYEVFHSRYIPELDIVVHVWKKAGKGIKYETEDEFPKGTILANAIKPVKEYSLETYQEHVESMFGVESPV